MPLHPRIRALLGAAGKLLPAPAAAAPKVAVAMSAFPIVLNPSDAQKVAHAKYRVDAITRYLEQSKAEGTFVPQEKIDELKSERAMYVAMLKHAKVI
jgi:hypothetical protein